MRENRSGSAPTVDPISFVIKCWELPILELDRLEARYRRSAGENPSAYFYADLARTVSFLRWGTP
jgi:hypothetical protein